MSSGRVELTMRTDFQSDLIAFSSTRSQIYKEENIIGNGKEILVQYSISWDTRRQLLNYIGIF